MRFIVVGQTPRAFAASLRLPAKYCWRTSKLICFSAFPLFLSEVFLVSLFSIGDIALWLPRVPRVFAGSVSASNCGWEFIGDNTPFMASVRGRVLVGKLASLGKS
uniref:Uncharacterized protein n=1 Tax=Opuntia streptacantha TaxID=393608 RepID=A0A7C9ETQ1_OPUST